MEEIHPSLIFMLDFYFGSARPPTPKPLTGSAQQAQQRSSGSVGAHGSAGHGHPSTHRGTKPSWEQPPLPRGGLDYSVPLLLSRSKAESSIVSQSVKPKSFDSTFSIKDAAFYMKITASKNKLKFASSVYKLCTHAGNKHCLRSWQAAGKVGFAICLHAQYIFPSHPGH